MESTTRGSVCDVQVRDNRSGSADRWGWDVIMQPFSVFGAGVLFAHGMVGGVLSLSDPKSPKVCRIPSLPCDSPCFYSGVAYVAGNNASVLIDYLHPRIIEVIADDSRIRSREIPWHLPPAVPRSISPAWGRKAWMTTLDGLEARLVLVDLDDGASELAKGHEGFEPPLLTMAGGSYIITGGECPVIYDSSMGYLQWLRRDLTVFHRITLGMNDVVGPTADGKIIVLELDSGSWLLRRFGVSAAATAVQHLENVPWQTADGVASLDDELMVVMGDSGNLFVSASQGRQWSKIEIDYPSLFYDAMKERCRGRP